jgi:hypothetical protein
MEFIFIKVFVISIINQSSHHRGAFEIRISPAKRKTAHFMAWHFKTKRDKLKKILHAQQLACHFSGYNDKQELLMCMKAKQTLERK